MHSLKAGWYCHGDDGHAGPCAMWPIYREEFPEVMRGYIDPQLGWQQAHCDNRILHAPGECEYCDDYPRHQEVRMIAHVAFTGHEPPSGWLPCPADAARPKGARNDHRRWAGNKPTSAEGDPSWPTETFASQVMYGDHGGRQPWPILERCGISLSRKLAFIRKLYGKR